MESSKGESTRPANRGPVLPSEIEIAEPRRYDRDKPSQVPLWILHLSSKSSTFPVIKTAGDGQNTTSIYLIRSFSISRWSWFPRSKADGHALDPDGGEGRPTL